MNAQSIATAVYYRFIEAALAVRRTPGSVEAFVDRLAAARFRRGWKNGKNHLVSGHLRRIFPGSSEDRMEAILKEYWRRHQRNMVSLFYLRRFDAATVDGIIEWQGRELLEQAVENGRGVLLLVPHYGDERSLHVLMGMKGYTVGVMTSRYLDMPPSVRRMKLHNGSRWNQLHFPGESPRWIHDTLGQGGVVHFAPTAYGGPTGTWVMNFGVPVLAPSSPWKIVSRGDHAVLTGYCTQLPGMKYSLEFKEFRVPSTREEMIQSLFREAEKKAFLNPGQYAWEQLLIRHRESNTISRTGRIPEDETVLEREAVHRDHDPERIVSIDVLRETGG